MAKKNPPKLGEQVVSDLDETIVTDPVPDEVPATELSPEEAQELEQILTEVQTEAQAVNPQVTPAEVYPRILLEDGGKALIPHHNNPPSWRITGIDGHVYDHCSESPDGEWVYRKQ